jgi:hypothetical protein
MGPKDRDFENDVIDFLERGEAIHSMDVSTASENDALSYYNDGLITEEEFNEYVGDYFERDHEDY